MVTASQEQSKQCQDRSTRGQYSSSHTPAAPALPRCSLCCGGGFWPFQRCHCSTHCSIHPSGLAAQVCRPQVNKNSFKGSFLFPACKSYLTPGKGICSSFDRKMPFLTPGEAFRVGRCWWGILLLGARGAKLKTTAGRERAPQPGSDRAQQLQGRATAMRQAQGEGGESPWAVQSRGIWSRAQLSWTPAQLS